MELVTLELSDAETATEILALQRRAYEIEARLIGSDDIPLLHESLEELQSCGETFVGALLDGRIVGAISWKVSEQAIDLHRLIVDPQYFRRRIGTALVRAALAAEPSVTRALVQTGADNEPARALYLREGFELTDELEIVPGLRVARFSTRLR